MTDSPPAIIYPMPTEMAGKPCVVITGTNPAIIGTYNDKGECVLSDPFYYRPAEWFDLQAQWSRSK